MDGSAQIVTSVSETSTAYTHLVADLPSPLTLVLSESR